MKCHSGQPEKTYTARQLEKIGCGVDTTIRRRYANIPDHQLTIIVVNNNKTTCYPFDLLTEQDQLKVILHEAAAECEAEAAEAKKRAAKRPAPKQTLPALTPAQPPAVADTKALAIPHATELTGRQDRVAGARYQLMKMIEKRPKHMKVTPFIRQLAAKTQSGEDEHLTAIANSANDKKGKRVGVSFDVLMHWWTKHLACGKQANAMAPKVKGEMVPTETLIDWLCSYQPGTAAAVVLPATVPAWVPFFLDAYRRPQKPSYHHAFKQICRTMPPAIQRPSYEQIRRIMKKIPDLYAEKGRMTGAEYNSLKGYVERDASGYEPMSICQIDGHSFKAYVAHPVTGAHFHPEVCAVICLTTKVLVGWNTGLAESHLTVGGAYKHACLTSNGKRGGIPKILEPDLGAGNKARINSDEYTGLFARLGTTVKFPERAGNPQGHGAIERSNQSIWIAAAKKLPTYTGKDMDRGAKRLVYDRLEKDLKQVRDEEMLGTLPKTSKILLSWGEFLEFLDDTVTEYNNTPHRALPKIKAPSPFNPEGPAISRHMSPNEYWDSLVEDGFKPCEIGVEDELYLEKICQPHVTVTVKRERFTLIGNTYHSADLAEYHNREVIVTYDIHNPDEVTVLDLAERYICHAQWNGNRRHARPVSQMDKAAMDRHNRRTKLAERRLDMIHAEADRKAIEVRAEHVELPQEVLDYKAREEREERQRLAMLDAPKVFADEHEVHADIRERERNGGFVSAYELQWATDKESSRPQRPVGLFATDQFCQGRFKPENQLSTEKAASAATLNGF